MINSEQGSDASHMKHLAVKAVSRPTVGTGKAAEISDDVGLMALMRIRWRLLVATVVVGVATGVAAAFLMTPVYRASTLLMPSEEGSRSGMLSSVLGQLGGMGMLAGLGIGGGNERITTEAVALLRSREFIEQFIQSNRLMPVLFSKEWDAIDRRWKSSVTNPPTPWMGYKLFTNNVMNVYQDNKTNLVTLNVDWTDRNAAAEWANELVEAVNDRIRQRTISQADQTIEYLNRELKTADTIELRQSLYAMLENEVKIRAIATVRKQYAFEVLDPAAPPDRNVMLRPRRTLYIVCGPIVGFGVGLAIALLLEGRRRRSLERARLSA